MKGIVTSNPLKSASYLGRLWGNIGGMLSRGAASDGGDAAMSLVSSDDFFGANLSIMGVQKCLDRLSVDETPKSCIKMENKND